MRHGNRTVTVKKKQLIETIKKNKANHIDEYAKAVESYMKEAHKQLADLKQQLLDGKTDIKLNLVEPKNMEQNYNDILKMFEWEVKEEVELTQDEFKEYVLDQTDFAIEAKFSNTFYLH